MPGKMPQARGMEVYIGDGYGAFRQPKFECRCYEMVLFMVCGVTENSCVQSLL